jgi:hypothetical protein
MRAPRRSGLPCDGGDGAPAFLAACGRTRSLPQKIGVLQSRAMTIAFVAALQLLFLAAAVSLARPLARAERDGETAVLAYPRAWRMGATVQLVVPVILALVVWLRRETLAPTAVTAELVLAVFLFAVLWLVRIEVAGVRHALAPEGIVRGSPWTGRTVIAWSEVARVRWSAAGQWLVVEARDGRRLRIPSLVSGLGDLAERVTARGGLSPDAFGPGVPERLARWVIALDGR